MSSEMLQKSLDELWSDYLFLSREMLKFADSANFDLFAELIDQRATMQSLISEASEQQAKSFPQNAEMANEIRLIDTNLAFRLQTMLNNLKMQRNVSQRYDQFNATNTGNYMDRRS